jgi:hypothetical protein
LRRRGGGFASRQIVSTPDRARRYHWGPEKESSVRGVNLMRLHGGLIVEALGYVKGA